MNGKHFRSTWPVFHFSVVFPHPARAAPGPPSPWGKATSGGGCIQGGRLSSLGVPSTPVPGFARSTLGKHRGPLIRPGLCPVHLPRGGMRPPAGAFPYLLLGEGADLRRKRGGIKSVLRTAPHPSGLRPATLSQERVFPHTRPGTALPPSRKERVFSKGAYIHGQNQKTQVVG